MDDRHPANPSQSVAACRTCGEPEDGGEFGWFDAETDLHAFEPTICLRCGSRPEKKRNPSHRGQQTGLRTAAIRSHKEVSQ